MTAIQSPKQEPTKVKRVKRPNFSKKDWENIFFENLFEEGLVGPRPERLDGAATAQTNNPLLPTNPNDNSGNTESAGGFAWSNYISRDSLEDEIKTLQLQLEKDVTTPVKFKSDYGKVRQSYAMLSLLFGVIRQYDSDVRWKKDAAAAQASFARAAANARVGSQQAYQSAKRRKEELQELVRGGGFTGDEKAPEKLEWPLVVDRSPIMVRLDDSDSLVKPMFANKTEFVANLDTIIKEAELVAAMSEVLLQEEMDDYDEDEYIGYAKSMSKAAQDLVAAAKAKNYDTAAPAFNLIQQACSNCHDEYQ